MLAGIIRPDEGEVRLAGVRIDRLGENRLSALRRRRFVFVFVFVFQAGQLLPEPPAAASGHRGSGAWGGLSRAAGGGTPIGQTT